MNCYRVEIYPVINIHRQIIAADYYSFADLQNFICESEINVAYDEEEEDKLNI